MTKVQLHQPRRPVPYKPNRRVWVLRWFGRDIDPRTGKPKRYGETIGEVGVMTKREAGAVRTKMQGELDNDLAPIDKPKRLGLEAFLRADRAAVSIDVKPRTIEGLCTAADHAIRALGADYDVQQLDYADVGRIKAHLASRELAAATITKTIRYLQSVFARGVKLRLIPSNPFQGVKLPKVQPRAVRIYKPYELKALVAVAPDLWWETLIRLGYTSGFRLGEMLNLQWFDLDFDAGTVKVQAKRPGSFRVGDGTYPVLEWTAKSYHDRTVPIPQETVTALQRLKAKSGGSVYAFLSLDRLAEIGAFMAAHDGKLPGSYKLVNNCMRTWQRIQDAAAAHLSAGRDEPCEWERRTLHDLRRTFGTMAAHHIPAHELRALMGHANLLTTQRFYLAIGDDLADRVRGAFKLASGFGV